MDRKAFLKAVCGLGACGCVAGVLEPAKALAAPQLDVADQRLVFVRRQVGHIARFMAAAPAAAGYTEMLEQAGRECAKATGAVAKFKGDPEGYFAAAHRAWGTEFQWDKERGIVTVSGGEEPCGCPLVDPKSTPAFFCSCSVGFQKEMFAALFGHPVEGTLKASKLAGAKRCVFEVKVRP